jgi:hypothetical protein
MREPLPQCAVCSKRTRDECSHVDCPNRRRITAQPVGSASLTRGNDINGRSVNGSAIVRRPHHFED